MNFAMLLFIIISANSDMSHSGKTTLCYSVAVHIATEEMFGISTAFSK